MLEHVGREAQRLGLGVDMATGTGWPFGGPRVAPEDSSKKIVRIGGRLGGEPTKMMVKRAAPGGEGLVLDPFSPDALNRYLAPFTKAFASFPRGLVRAQFHDSFEYYGAGWTEKLPETFRRMHGYDIHTFDAVLLGDKAADADTLGRVKSDYRCCRWFVNRSPSPAPGSFDAPIARGTTTSSRISRRQRSTSGWRWGPGPIRQPSSIPSQEQTAVPRSSEPGAGPRSTCNSRQASR